MLPTYELTPHSGAGPILLGMTKAQVRATMPETPDTFRKSTDGQVVDAWHDSCLQVFYSTDGISDYIEISRGAIAAHLFGLDVLAIDAETVIRAMLQHAPCDNSKSEAPYGYVFSTLDLSFWRQLAPEDAHDTEGRLFDTVGIGVAGYYGSAS